jgi:hypothetical protein
MSSLQTGGDLFSDVRSLAVPFSLILARIGIEKMKAQYKTTPKGASNKKQSEKKPKAVASAKKTPAVRKSKKMTGGCGCSGVRAPMTGGGADSIENNGNFVLQGVNDLLGGGFKWMKY